VIGLIQIFRLCGRTLKNLNVGFSNITGERSFHCSETPLIIENLDLMACKKKYKLRASPDTSALWEYAQISESSRNECNRGKPGPFKGRFAAFRNS